MKKSSKLSTHLITINVDLVNCWVGLRFTVYVEETTCKKEIQHMH